MFTYYKYEPVTAELTTVIILMISEIIFPPLCYMKYRPVLNKVPR
jgi:hypothetical protein